MLAIKQKWTQLRTYQRLQKLWSDYVAVAEVNNKEGQEKLNNFLDTFQSAYSEHAGALEKIFGDCTDILVALLKVVETESEATGKELRSRKPGDENLIALAQVLNKALSVAELIVRDEKYRNFVKESPTIINNILSLLEKMNAKDSKKLALRLIYSLSNEHDGKLAIGKNDGFRRIVRLLLEGDEDLTREILRTINHFLEDEKLRSMFELAPSPPVSGWAAFRQNFQKAARAKATNGSLEFVRQKVESVVTDVTRLLSNEMGSLEEGGNVSGEFLPPGGGGAARDQEGWFVVQNANHYETMSVWCSRVLAGEWDCTLSLTVAEPEPSAVDDGAKGKKPKKWEKEKDKKSFAEKNTARTREKSAESGHGPDTTGEDDGTGSPTVERATSPGADSLEGGRALCTPPPAAEAPANPEEDILRELMRAQGVLSQLAGSIVQTTKDLQLELLETISKLLFHNKRNQTEFRDLNGYSFLFQLFEQLHDYSGPERREFLKNVFAVITTIITDGNKDRVAGNLDCLKLLPRLVESKSHVQVRLQALQALGLLMIANPLNTAALRAVGCIDMLCRVIKGADELTWGMAPKKRDAKSNKKAPKTLQTESPELYDEVFDVLNTMAVLGCAHNWEVMDGYIDILVSSTPVSPTVRNKTLCAIVDLISDATARGLKPPGVTGMNAVYERALMGLWGLISRHVHDLGGRLSVMEPMVTLDDEMDFDIEIDRSSSVISSTAASSSMGSSTLGAMGMTERDMLYVLQIIGMIICQDQACADRFNILCGFQLFRELMNPVFSARLNDMSLSLLMSLANHTPTVAEYVFPCIIGLVKQVDRTTPMVRKVYEYTSVLLRSKLDSRIAFQRHGGLEALIECIKTGDAQVARMAFELLGDAITGCESSKAWICDVYGCCEFANLVKGSALELDVELFTVVMELASIGSVKVALDSTDLESKMMRAYISADVQSFVDGVFIARVYKPLVGNKDKVSVPESSSGPMSGRSGSKPKSKQKPEKDDDRDDDAQLSTLMPPGSLSPLDYEAGFAALSYGSCVDQDNARVLEEETIAKNLSIVKFRKTEAALMLTMLLSSSAQEVQMSVCNTLLLLLQRNPANKQALCQMHGFPLLLKMARVSEDLRMAYTEMATELALYDLRSSEAAFLFQVAGIVPSGDSPVALEQHMSCLLLLARLCERFSPRSFYYLNGSDAAIRFPLVRFPSQKNGFTIALWIRCMSIPSSEASLITFRDAHGHQIFELYLKEEPAPDGSNRRSGQFYLCASARNPVAPFAPESHSFDFFKFTTAELWHHVVITHKKKTLTVILDGEHSRSCDMDKYPKGPKVQVEVGSSSDGDVTLDTVEQEPKIERYFCGQLSTVRLEEGAWDIQTAMQVFDQGILAREENQRKHTSEHKKIWYASPSIHWRLNIIPRKTSFLSAGSGAGSHGAPFDMLALSTLMSRSVDSNLSISPAVNAMLSPRALSPGMTSTVPPSADFAMGAPATDLISSPGSSSNKGVKSDELIGGVEVHCTRTIHDAIEHIGGIEVCFAFLQLGSGARLAGLRILVGLLVKEDRLQAEFDRVGGWKFLNYVLTKTPPTLETFELLVDLLADGTFRDSHALFKVPEPFMLVLDLIPLCDNGLKAEVLDILCTEASALASNLRFLQQQNVLPRLIGLVRTVGEEVRPSVLKLMGALSTQFGVEEVEMVADVCMSCQSPPCDVTRDVVDMIFIQMLQRPTFLDQVWTVTGFNLALGLMSQPTEALRIRGIQIVGILFRSSGEVQTVRRGMFGGESSVIKADVLFSRVGGYDAMMNILAQSPASAAVCTSLLGLALDSTPVLRPPSASMSSPSNGEELSYEIRPASDDMRGGLVIAFPEVLRVLFDVLRRCDDNVQLQVVKDIVRLLTSNNMSIIWEHPWLDWVEAYGGWKIGASDNESDTNSTSNASTHVETRLCTEVFKLVGNMILHEMSRPVSKGAVTKLQKLRDLNDATEFQWAVIEHVLLHLKRYPALNNIDAAKNILRSLVYLYEIVEECMAVTPSVCVRFLGCIVAITIENTATVRTKMKELGVLDIRDDLVICFLRATHSDPTSAEILFRFSFDSLVVQPKFRDAGGIQYLMHLFLTTSDPYKRMSLCDIIANAACHSEENRKAIAKMIEEPVAVSKFVKALDDYNTPASPKGVVSPRRVDSGGDQVGDVSVDEFVDWYFADEQAGMVEAALARVQKAVGLQDASLVVKAEKAAKAQAKRVKQRADKKAKTSAATLKQTTEKLDKVKARVERAVSNMTKLTRHMEEEDAAAIVAGTAVWRRVAEKTSKAIVLVGTPNSGGGNSLSPPSLPNPRQKLYPRSISSAAVEAPTETGSSPPLVSLARRTYTPRTSDVNRYMEKNIGGNSLGVEPAVVDGGSICSICTKSFGDHWELAYHHCFEHQENKSPQWLGAREWH